MGEWRELQHLCLDQPTWWWWLCKGLDFCINPFQQYERHFQINFHFYFYHFFCYVFEQQYYLFTKTLRLFHVILSNYVCLCHGPLYHHKAIVLTLVMLELMFHNNINTYLSTFFGNHKKKRIIQHTVLMNWSN